MLFFSLLVPFVARKTSQKYVQFQFKCRKVESSKIEILNQNKNLHETTWSMLLTLGWGLPQNFWDLRMGGRRVEGNDLGVHSRCN